MEIKLILNEKQEIIIFEFNIHVRITSPHHHAFLLNLIKMFKQKTKKTTKQFNYLSSQKVHTIIITLALSSGLGPFSLA